MLNAAVSQFEFLTEDEKLGSDKNEKSPPTFWQFLSDHIFLTCTFNTQFYGSKIARIVLVGCHSSASLLVSFFAPGVIRFEVFRLTAQIKGNDVTECLYFMSLFLR